MLGRGGPIMPPEEKDDLVNELMTKVFVEQLLTLPGSANTLESIV